MTMEEILAAAFSPAAKQHISREVLAGEAELDRLRDQIEAAELRKAELQRKLAQLAHWKAVVDGMAVLAAPEPAKAPPKPAAPAEEPKDDKAVMLLDPLSSLLACGLPGPSYELVKATFRTIGDVWRRVEHTEARTLTEAMEKVPLSAKVACDLSLALQIWCEHRDFAPPEPKPLPAPIPEPKKPKRAKTAKAEPPVPESAKAPKPPVVASEEFGPIFKGAPLAEPPVEQRLIEECGADPIEDLGLLMSDIHALRQHEFAYIDKLIDYVREVEAKDLADAMRQLKGLSIAGAHRVADKLERWCETKNVPCPEPRKEAV